MLMVPRVVLSNSNFSCPVFSFPGFLTSVVVENRCIVSQIINSISIEAGMGQESCCSIGIS